MKRISKAVREEAIEALLCCADDRIRAMSPLAYLSTFDGRDTRQLAYSAYVAAVNAMEIRYPIGNLEAYAEAAALLLDGWNPGDPVEVRQ